MYNVPSSSVGEDTIGRRVRFRQIAKPEFDRIHSALLGELIHERLYREDIGIGAEPAQ